MAQSAMKHGSSVQEIATVSQGLCRHGRLKGETAQGSVSVLSWNVQRYDAPWFQAAPWRLRRAGVLRRLRQIEADIVCLQEVLHPVRDDIEVALPGHRWVGVGRRDGRTEGEYAPILFRTAKYRMQDEGCFWLSEQPSRPSVGWDAQLPRIATWVRLEDAAGQSFLVLNTHFDHRGRRAREQSAWLLARETVRLSRGDPSIVTGDLNARARDDPLRTLQLFLVNGALDQRGHAEGPSATHLAGRIDHVLYSRHFARLAGRTLPARGLSDHATLHYVLARQEPGLIV
ncbi:MAG: endonuclease/exonuclease/phosphatase family protein [Alphaproteobacteria bacterium]|nr:endonuclease/exonuclease/phosphatase family protein [Alphaproteobacteria bacterium]